MSDKNNNKEIALAHYDANGQNAELTARALGMHGGSIRKWVIKRERKQAEQVNAKISRFQTNVNKRVNGYRGLVVTSCTNDADIDENFYLALKRYCVHHGYLLMVTPVYYKYSEGTSKFLADECDMFMEDVQLKPSLKVMPSLRISATAANPTMAKDIYSKGMSLILSHPQMAMRVLPTIGCLPHVLHSTASMNKRTNFYPENATGIKAEINHSLGAIVIQLGDGDSFHYRQLNGDDDHGFFDINGYWSADAFKPLEKGDVVSIYMGDSHVEVMDPQVKAATWTNPDSIVNVLQPAVIIEGDIFDCQAVSHHDKMNQLIQIGNSKFGYGNLRDGLNKVGDYLVETYQPGVTRLVVASNHPDHLNQHLASKDAAADIENGEIYHFLMWKMYGAIQRGDAGPRIPSALVLFLEHFYSAIFEYTKFTGRRESVKILGIEVSQHGDKGANGAKGSATGFAKFSDKVIHGHTHTPGITQGCWTVGTKSLLHLSYTSGASSWMHTDCLIYKNGKRQLINIVNGKWRI